MGFFSSSKSELASATLPSLELQFGHSGDTVIKPNDTISGHILLSTPVVITPKAVEVTFWGQSQTWIRTESSNTNSSTGSTSSDYYHYRDLAPLFAVTRNILTQTKEDAHVPGKAYAIPFAFIMPTETTSDRASFYQHPEDDIWTVSSHNLPPTFCHGKWGPDTPDNCSITYGITARLICPEFAIDQVVCTAPILFSPLNPYANIKNPNRLVYKKKFVLSSSILSGQSPSSIGFRQSIKDKFSSHTPRLDFELGVELPELLSSGSEFSFKATLTTLNKSENVTLIPNMSFRVLKLELLDFTLFRAPRDWKANSFRSGAPSTYYSESPRSYRAGDEQVCDQGKTLLNSLPETITVELPQVSVEKEVKQGTEYEAWFKGRVPGLTSPSFKSFSITRSYQIKMRIGVNIGGRDFDFKVDGSNVQIGSVD